MNQSFNIKRIGWLSKKEFYESFLPHFKIITIVLSAIVLVRFIVAYFEPSNDVTMHSFSYEGMFVIFGFIYVVNSFSELKLLPTRSDFLTLPATTAEKVFTKWLFANVLYWIGVLLVVIVFYFIQKLIIGLFMGKTFESFQYFSKELITGLHYIIVVFSVYFFGAAAFNTGAWYKVILWAVLFSLVYIALVFVFGYMLFPEFRAELHGENIHRFNSNVPVDLILEEFWIIKLAKFFIKYLAAPFFWFMTYLKIKEKEV